jgi:heptaprenyl diphosphate synthase
MQSHDNEIRRQVLTKTVWLLCAVALNAVEFFVPRLPFFPWLKPGLANVITMLWIIEFGFTDALVYCLLRIWITGFYFGFSFLSLSLSASGGILATIAMGAFWGLFGKKRLLGTVGLGIVGAMFHNTGQIIVVYFLMAANHHLFYQVPVMLIASVAFGGLVGLCAPLALTVLSAPKPKENIAPASLPAAPQAARRDFFFSFLLLFASMAIVFLDSKTMLGVCAICASLLVQVQKKGSLQALVRPVTGFWVLFLFIACINLFFSYGTYLAQVPFLTREGVDLTLKQCLRLWTWLEISFLLSYFNFHSVMFASLRSLFPAHKETIFSGLLALEYFPAIAEESKTYAKKSLAKAVSSLFGSKKAEGSSSIPVLRPRKRITEALTKKALEMYGMVVARLEAKEH